jgi:hypothetical protein
MKDNYIPFFINDFSRIQKILQNHYRNEYQGTSLKAFPKEWNRENFLELYDIVDKFFKDNKSEIISSRFFFTPAGKSLGVHIDGKVQEPNYWALNIPIFCEEKDHWQEWFEYDGELQISENSVYANYILPKDPSKLKLIDQLTLTTPHILRVGVFHRVVNKSSSDRLIVSIRFNTESLDNLLNVIRESQFS